jgi:hypothetical protein
MSTPVPTAPNEDPTQLVRAKEAESGWRIENSVQQLGGFSLLAFALFNILRIIISRGPGFANEASMAQMSQFLSIYPVLLLGLILTFSTPNATKTRGFWLGITRWLVLLITIVFLSFVPLAFYHRSAILNQSARQQSNLKAVLEKRKNDILTRFQGISSPDEFRRVLTSLPEVRNVDIPATQTAEQIRRDIRSGIDRAITREIQRFKENEQRRITSLNAITRDLVMGSLLAGGTLTILAVYLHPWLAQAGRGLLPFKKIASLGATQATGAKATRPTPRRKKFTRRLARYLAYISHDVVNSLPRSFKRSSRSRRR